MKKSSQALKNNYIVVQSWMTQELGLKGTQLILYALIYGFSQTDKQSCTCGIDYMIAWTKASKQGVLKALDSLIAEGLIERIKGNSVDGRRCEYRIIGQQSLPNLGKKKVNKVYLISQEKGQQSLPNLKKIGKQSYEKGQQSLPNSLPLKPPDNNIYNINNKSSVSQSTCAHTREDDGLTEMKLECLKKLENLLEPHMVENEIFGRFVAGGAGISLQENANVFAELLSKVAKRKSWRINGERHPSREVIETLSKLADDEETFTDALKKLPDNDAKGIKNKETYSISILYNFVQEEL